MAVGLLLAAVAVAVAVAVVTGVAGHSRVWSARLSLASPDRTSLKSVAFRMWQAHPLTGVGPGHAVYIWTTPAHRVVTDRFAHDEHLQLADEQGVVGLAGLGVLAAAVAVTVRQRRHRRSGRAAESSMAALHAGAVAGLLCPSVPAPSTSSGTFPRC